MADTQAPLRHPAGTLEELRQYNTKKDCRYSDFDLQRIDRKWRMWGKWAAQPASLRGDRHRV